MRELQRGMKEKSLTIEIPMVPTSQNNTKKLSHWGQMDREKKKWERIIMKYGYIWRGGPAKKVFVTFYFPDNRRRDVDNYAYFKGILDGLTKAGIIADDSVKDVDVRWDIKIGTGERKTIVEVEK